MTTLNRIKYDPQLLLHYLFDGKPHDDVDNNTIKIYKVRVKKTGGTLLSHYYATISIGDSTVFEFHPGSQPKTFQNPQTDGISLFVVLLCDECCKQELTRYVLGENNFNIAFNNCESILCKRLSMQTVFIVLILTVVAMNMAYFSMFYIFFIIFLVILLYINNNYMISSPYVLVCKHKATQNEPRY